MRYLRFALLKTYIASIQKHKKKALLLINTGIFFSIFAVSSAIVTFFIERNISIKQSEIIKVQIEIKESSSSISDFEMMIDKLDLSLKNEEDTRVDKQLFSETKLGNKIFSAKDFYTPFLQYTKRELKDLEKAIIDDEEFENMNFSSLLDINSEFNKEIINTIEQSWSEELVQEFTESIILANKRYNVVKKINFEEYEFPKYQSLEEISQEIREYEKFHINKSGPKLIDDYFAVIDFEYAMKKFFTQYLILWKSINTLEKDYLEELNNEILDLSKKEKNIIFITFLLQFLIFIIIQIFELNSINLSFKKKIL